MSASDLKEFQEVTEVVAPQEVTETPVEVPTEVTETTVPASVTFETEIPADEGTVVEVTPEVLEENPKLAELGVEVGHEVVVPVGETLETVTQ